MAPLGEAETQKCLDEWMSILEEPLAHSPLHAKLGVLKELLMCESLEVQMSLLDCALEP
jgi:hypothetical protein